MRFVFLFYFLFFFYKFPPLVYGQWLRVHNILHGLPCLLIARIIMNGWGVYITWCVIASLLNLTIALTYVGGTDMKVFTSDNILII